MKGKEYRNIAEWQDKLTVKKVILLKIYEH